MATTTLVLAGDYLGSKVGTSHKMRIRYTNPDDQSELNFAKAPSAADFGSSNEARFVMDPKVDGGMMGAGGAGMAKLGFKNSAADKTFYSVNADKDTLRADFLQVSSTATIESLVVNALYATSLTVVNTTQSVNLFVTSDKVVVDELQVTAGVTVGSLFVSGDAGVTGALEVTGTSLLRGAATATSTLDVYGASRLRSTLRVDAAATLNDAATIAGPVTINNTALITGSASISGGAIISGGATIVGDSSVDGALRATGKITAGSLEVSNAAAIGTTLTVGSDATVGAALRVGGGATVTNDLRVGGSANIIGDATVGTSLAVTYDGSFGRNLTVGGTGSIAGFATLGSGIHVTGAADITGKAKANELESAAMATVGSDLKVKGIVTAGNLLSLGAATLNHTLVVGTSIAVPTINATDVNVAGALTVTGDADFKGGLGLLNLTVSNTASIGGAVTLGNSLDVTKDVTITGGLTVTGAAALKNSLSVSGAATITGAATILGGLTVSGGSTLSADADGQLFKLKNNSGLDVATLSAANGFNATGATRILSVTGDVLLNDTLNVGGDLYANGDLFVTQSLTVYGKSTLGGDVAVVGTAAIDGELHATGAIISLYSKAGGANKAIMEADANQFQMTLFGVGSADKAHVVGKASDLDLQHMTLVKLSAPLVNVSNELNITGATTIHSTLYVTEAATVKGALNALADATVGANLNILNRVTAGSHLTVGGDATLAGNLQVGTAANIVGFGTIGGGLYVGAAADITGAITVTGDASLLANLLVSANASITGSAIIGRGLTIKDYGLTVQAGPTNLQLASVVGGLTVANGATVDHLNVQSTSHFVGALSASDGVTLYGFTTLMNDILIAGNNGGGGNATMTGFLSVAAKATVGQDLWVSGAADITGDLRVTGLANIKGDVLAGTLAVSGATTLAANVYAQDILVSGGVTITGNLLVTGGISGSSFGTVSDVRLKKDIAEIEGALAKVSALRPVEYNWNSGAETFNAAHKEIGFIAQEVEAVIPNVVSTAEGPEGIKRVAYDRITSLLVAAVKEQAAVIERLTERIAALESRA